MSDIIEVKTLLKTQLNAYAGLTALVPVARILSSWPDSFATLPLITFNELDNFNTDEDIFDDQPICDTSQVEIHIWQKVGVSTTPIFKQLNACMESNRWTRFASVDLVDPETKLQHKVLRYNNTLFR